MSSQERIEANRANSQHSTGPSTPEGKARASRNALKHGLLSREVVVDGEDRAEFEAFRDGLVADLAPEGDLEAVLGERIACQWWRLRRVARMEASLIGRDEGRDVAAGEGEALAASLGAQYCPYETLRRYERAIERGLDASMRQFREAQKLRASRENGQAQADREQERRQEMDRSYADLRRRFDWALGELTDLRAVAKAAGVRVGRSMLLEEEYGWPSDEEGGGDSEAAAAEGAVSQRGAEGAPRPAEAPEEQRYGRDREE
jgi:hypothetical protein